MGCQLPRSRYRSLGDASGAGWPRLSMGPCAKGWSPGRKIVIECPQSAGTAERLLDRKLYRSWRIYQSIGVDARFQVENLVFKPGTGAKSAATAIR